MSNKDGRARRKLSGEEKLRILEEARARTPRWLRRSDGIARRIITLTALLMMQ
jgi:hypothetical protein